MVQFFDSLLEKIASVTGRYASQLSFKVELNEFEDSYRFPVMIREQILPLYDGVVRFRRHYPDCSATIKFQVAFFWEDEETGEIGLTTHHNLLSLSNILWGGNLLETLEPEEPSIKVLCLAFVKIIIEKTHL